MDRRKWWCMAGICLLISGIISCANLVNKDECYHVCFHGEQIQGENTPFVVVGKNIAVLGIPKLSVDTVWCDISGVWLDSTKLVNGMWLKISDGVNNEERVLEVSGIQVYPHYLLFDYPNILGGIKVESRLLASDTESGIIQTFSIENQTDRKRSVNIEFIVESNVGIASSHKGIENVDRIRNMVEWDNKGKMFVLKNRKKDCYVVWGSDFQVASFGTGVSFKNNVSTASSSMYSQLRLKPGETQKITYLLVGSKQHLEDAKSSYFRLWKNKDKELTQKEKNISVVLKNASLQDNEKEKVLGKKYYWDIILKYWQHSNTDSKNLPINELIDKMMENCKI